ncbi:uncharacterized protein PADG_05234 [Paracoccidioides brasiliensis Pb18]|uniref:Uncharacterized protein n=1 Tax=Paracoccidioides brasiliensis (strain Pb18) TaxID=502780 RepID=C1GD98_PARBD|nr:uncharacterized protein PADG_05234 [Paracoccidioides brasiliensis Pb18]EEH49155.2 hypothetical protein PADG_05234 [Paracoccidioides brasiliensis Pb18]
MDNGTTNELLEPKPAKLPASRRNHSLAGYHGLASDRTKYSGSFLPLDGKHGQPCAARMNRHSVNDEVKAIRSEDAVIDSRITIGQYLGRQDRRKRRDCCYSHMKAD